MHLLLVTSKISEKGYFVTLDILALVIMALVIMTWDILTWNCHDKVMDNCTTITKFR